MASVAKIMLLQIATAVATMLEAQPPDVWLQGTGPSSWPGFRSFDTGAIRKRDFLAVLTKSGFRVG